MEYIVETSRLALRRFVPGDLDFLAEMLTDDETTRFYDISFTQSDVDHWLERIYQRYENDGYSFWLAEQLETRQPIGQVGLLNQEVEGISYCELGYMLHRMHWRQGFAAEAACAVRDYAFNTLNKQKIVSLIVPANIPSQRVAMSYGAKPEKLVVWREREHLMFSCDRSRFV